jgi:hypothetical protein
MLQSVCLRDFLAKFALDVFTTGSTSTFFGTLTVAPNGQVINSEIGPGGIAHAEIKRIRVFENEQPQVYW